MEIKKVIRPIKNGATKPYVIECTDGNQYVAKFPGNPDGTRVLINEYVCACLAQMLQLPIPSFELIYINNIEFYSNYLEGIELINGTAFCSRMIDKASPVPGYRALSKVSNLDDIVKILIFDVIIGNNDRNPGNLLINLKNKSLVMIDHSHVFIYEAIWDAIQLKKNIRSEISIGEMNQFSFSMLSVEISKVDKEVYKKFKETIKSINKDDIINIIDSIPKDWSITNDDKEVLADFLYDRIERIDEIYNILKIDGGD